MESAFRSSAHTGLDFFFSWLFFSDQFPFMAGYPYEGTKVGLNISRLPKKSHSFFIYIYIRRIVGQVQFMAAYNEPQEEDAATGGRVFEYFLHLGFS